MHRYWSIHENLLIDKSWMMDQWKAIDVFMKVKVNGLFTTGGWWIPKWLIDQWPKDDLYMNGELSSNKWFMIAWRMIQNRSMNCQKSTSDLSAHIDKPAPSNLVWFRIKEFPLWLHLVVAPRTSLFSRYRTYCSSPEPSCFDDGRFGLRITNQWGIASHYQYCPIGCKSWRWGVKPTNALGNNTTCAAPKRKLLKCGKTSQFMVSRVHNLY